MYVCVCMSIRGMRVEETLLLLVETTFKYPLRHQVLFTKSTGIVFLSLHAWDGATSDTLKVLAHGKPSTRYP